ncbi:MAG: hypothetical protein IK084_01195 [Bacteroidaceae bacterium]|nr:hypothetical protein [Bacteroidaceae bacterium]
MKKTDAEAFADELIKRGYRKWTQVKYGEENYDVSRVVHDEDGENMYQIIYRFWDWTMYDMQRVLDEFSISIVIMPRLHIYGRADLILSNCEFKHFLDIDWTEKFAKEYYEFITKRIKDGKD